MAAWARRYFGTEPTISCLWVWASDRGGAAGEGPSRAGPRSRLGATACVQRGVRPQASSRRGRATYTHDGRSPSSAAPAAADFRPRACHPFAWPGPALPNRQEPRPPRGFATHALRIHASSARMPAGSAAWKNACRQEGGAQASRVRRTRTDSRATPARAQGLLTLAHAASILVSVAGEWRSLVARLLREQEVAGSNPVSPTIYQRPGCPGLFHVPWSFRVAACASISTRAVSQRGQRWSFSDTMGSLIGQGIASVGSFHTRPRSASGAYGRVTL
jgi:hypothetical protein